MKWVLYMEWLENLDIEVVVIWESSYFITKMCGFTMNVQYLCLIVNILSLPDQILIILLASGTESSSVTKEAARLMDSCQLGTISSDTGFNASQCSEIVLNTIVYHPTPPRYLAFNEEIESQHENVPFLNQPKIRAFDQFDNVVDHLGITEAPWEITASIISCSSCHGDAALIGTTTVVSKNGWFNFTDLGISHKGEEYVIEFAISAPPAAVATNLSVTSRPLYVVGLPMTADIHSMTATDIEQGSTFSITFDLRDNSTNIQIPDLTWRDHTAFDISCDLVAPSETGSLSGTLIQSFDMVTGLSTFDDIVYTGYGLFYIGCHVESSMYTSRLQYHRDG
ncbi:hypothetical protein ACF0H5_009424 [Mactra antiquata]